MTIYIYMVLLIVKYVRLPMWLLTVCLMNVRGSLDFFECFHHSQTFLKLLLSFQGKWDGHKLQWSHRIYPFGLEYVVLCGQTFQISFMYWIYTLIVALQLSANAADAFKHEGIHLDTSILLPAFQDPFPYHLLFTWVSIGETNLFLNTSCSYFLFV